MLSWNQRQGCADLCFQLRTRMLAPPTAGLGLKDAAAVPGITSRDSHAQRKNRGFVFQNQGNSRGPLALNACKWVHTHSKTKRWQEAGAG